ncbi:MAG: HAD family hydrolase [Isosphaeraceae bacterium]
MAQPHGESYLTMTPHPIVFLLDVDNTLFDNDQFERDLRRHLEEKLGVDRQARYWEIFEELRAELGYADYLGAVQRLRIENMHEPRMLEVSSFLLEYPFAERLYPGVLDLIARLRGSGPVVIVSDGDAVFQPRKLERSGLIAAVEGNVLIYIHKDREMGDISARYPANHYVLVDDKLSILTTMKKAWGSRVTTVFPRQGHYAHDPKNGEMYSPADITIEHIGDLLHIDLPTAIEFDAGEAFKNTAISRESSS